MSVGEAAAAAVAVAASAFAIAREGTGDVAAAREGTGDVAVAREHDFKRSSSLAVAAAGETGVADIAAAAGETEVADIATNVAAPIPVAATAKGAGWGVRGKRKCKGCRAYKSCAVSPQFRRYMSLF